MISAPLSRQMLPRRKHQWPPPSMCSGLLRKLRVVEKERASQRSSLPLDKSMVKNYRSILRLLSSFLTRPPHLACALPHQRRICLKPQRSHNRQKRSSPGSRCRCLWFWREEKRGEKVTQPHGSFLLSADLRINGGIKHRGR